MFAPHSRQCLRHVRAAFAPSSRHSIATYRDTNHLLARGLPVSCTKTGAQASDMFETASYDRAVTRAVTGPNSRQLAPPSRQGLRQLAPSTRAKLATRTRQKPFNPVRNHDVYDSEMTHLPHGNGSQRAQRAHAYAPNASFKWAR